MSLVELLTAVAIVGILAGTSITASRRPLAHQQLLAAARQLELGIEQARDQAMDQQTPCALALGEAGWVEPDSGSLPACTQATGPLLAGDRGAGLQLQHNISELQFTTEHQAIGGELQFADVVFELQASSAITSQQWPHGTTAARQVAACWRNPTGFP